MSTKASKYTKHENEKSYVQWRWKQIEMGARFLKKCFGLVMSNFPFSGSNAYDVSRLTFKYNF